MDENTRRQGEELNQLSRLIFGKAADFWYTAVVIEFIAGAMGVAATAVRPQHTYELLLAVLGFLLFATAYYLKISFRYLYDTAETMRRQSALTEALGWPIGKTQFSQWRLRAGQKILRKAEVETRDPDYYESSEREGPRRLLEMTSESAFYTRHLYARARKPIWVAFTVVILAVAVVIGISAAPVLPSGSAYWVAYIVFLLLPVFLAIDLLSWGIELNRLTDSLDRIEEGLENLEQASDADLSAIMRLVSEYNCQVVKGFPISNWFFNRHHQEIKELWDKRCS